jgi:hypothetical protein
VDGIAVICFGRVFAAPTKVVLSTKLVSSTELVSSAKLVSLQKLVSSTKLVWTTMLTHLGKVLGFEFGVQN